MDVYDCSNQGDRSAHSEAEQIARRAEEYTLSGPELSTAEYRGARFFPPDKL